MVWCTLSLHMFTKNNTSRCVIAKKVLNFVGRFTDKFSRDLCLDFVQSLMASQVTPMRAQGFEW